MSLSPSDMICFTLYSAAQAMQQAYRPLLAPLGLTYPQYLVLRALWSLTEAPTVKDVTGAVHLESSTLTPLLKRLETAGLVTRRRDDRDERQVRIHLTDAGRRMEADAAHIPACMVAKTGMEMAELLRLKEEVSGLDERLRSKS